MSTYSFVSKIGSKMCSLLIVNKNIENMIMLLSSMN